MTTKAEFEALATPLRANLKRAIAALDALSGADFDDEAQMGRLAKACFLASLGSRGLAALSIPDPDYVYAKGSNVILNAE